MLIVCASNDNAICPLLTIMCTLSVSARPLSLSFHNPSFAHISYPFFAIIGPSSLVPPTLEITVTPLLSAIKHSEKAERKGSCDLFSPL
jgi:hypothetical protein